MPEQHGERFVYEERPNTRTRYWGYLAGKLAVSGALSYGFLWGVNYLWPLPAKVFNLMPPRFGYDLVYTIVIGLWFLVC